MPTKEEQVVFRLNAMCRYDEEVKAFVGYIPRLQIYTQAKTKESLLPALQVTALQFIIACANKHILGSVMRDGGARPVAHVAHENIADKDTEFVAVMGYVDCEQPLEIAVPLSIIAQQENAVIIA